MKMTVRIKKEEALAMLGAAVLTQFFANRADLRVEEVDFDAYRTNLEIEITDEPDLAKTIAPALGSVAA